MAFPTNPSNGDEHNGYIYNNGAWIEFNPREHWAYKEGPTSYVSPFKNNWSSGGGEGDSLDATSSADGINILKDGLYEIRTVQRSSGIDGYINVSLNGNRSALEDKANSMWNHDHSAINGNYSESNFIGWLTAGNKITAGPPSSSTSSSLSYGSTGYIGTIKVKRLK